MAWGSYSFFRDFLVVRTIKIVDSPAGIPKGAKSLGGQNIVFLNSQKWEQIILKKNPLLKKVEIKKQFPFQILLKFEKRKPRAVIFDPQKEKYFFIDDQAVILEEKELNQELPLIVAGLQNFKIGDRIRNEKIDLSLALISVLKEKSRQAKFEVEADLNDLRITLPEGILILVGLERKREDLIYSLQSLIQKFKIEGNWPKKIDLRFEKPVLTF